MLGKLIGVVFKLPLVGGLLKKAGEGLVSSLLKGFLKQGSTKKALHELGKIAGKAAADVVPNDLEDATAHFLDGFAEALEKAN